MKTRIKELREFKNISQIQLEEKSGVERGYISKLENGKLNPTMKTLEKLATALNCTINELLDEKEKPPNDGG